VRKKKSDRRIRVRHLRLSMVQQHAGLPVRASVVEKAKGSASFVVAHQCAVRRGVGRGRDLGWVSALAATLPMRLRTASLTLARPCLAMLSLSASMMLMTGGAGLPFSAIVTSGARCSVPKEYLHAKVAPPPWLA
jgi:hypothetical protein